MSAKCQKRTFEIWMSATIGGSFPDQSYASHVALKAQG